MLGVLALLPDERGRELLGDPPRGVRVAILRDGGVPEDARDGEFLVLSAGDRDVALRALRGLPRLRAVQTLGAGVDWVLPDVPPGVVLCDARGVHDATVAEWVAAVLLADSKRLADFEAAAAAARWEPGPVGDVSGTTVLILGYGSIGAALEARLSPFEVSVLRVARTAREGVSDLAALPALLPQADVVVLLLPLTEATRGLVDAGFLRRMRPGSLLVNAARGPVVDTTALVQALERRHVRAALDVTDPEPLPPDSPLWRAPGVRITPHVAGSTPLFLPRAYRLVRAQLERYAAGEPLANVVGDTGY